MLRDSWFCKTYLILLIIFELTCEIYNFMFFILVLEINFADSYGVRYQTKPFLLCTEIFLGQFKRL